MLQLTNLHGDIVATAYLSETATGPASTADMTEYGVPTTNLPPKYSWLGALQLPTELPSGVVSMGARSYVPQIGRYLQDDPVPGGSANAYTYTFGDPINTSDPTGAYVATPAWAIAFSRESAHAATVRAEEEARRAAEEAAARAAAEAAAQQAAAEAALAGGPAYAGEEESEEEEWEEGEEGGEEGESVAWHNQAGSNDKEEHAGEEAFLQQLVGESGEPNDLDSSSQAAQPCRTTGGQAIGQGVPCIRYASIFGDAWHWVKKHAKKLWHLAIAAHDSAMRLSDPTLINIQTSCQIISWASIFGGPFVPEATVFAKGLTIATGVALKQTCG